MAEVGLLPIQGITVCMDITLTKSISRVHAHRISLTDFLTQTAAVTAKPVGSWPAPMLCWAEQCLAPMGEHGMH